MLIFYSLLVKHEFFSRSSPQKKFSTNTILNFFFITNFFVKNKFYKNSLKKDGFFLKNEYLEIMTLI